MPTNTNNTANATGVVTAEIRKSDGASIARELYATYPVRLHLTSRPNELNNKVVKSNLESKIKSVDERNTKTERNGQKALCCYVLGYGGGLVSGDFIDLKFKVNPKASLVITSQSTSKAFKAIPQRDATFVRTNAAVDLGGLLVLVPQPTQCFAQSKFIQETNVFVQLQDQKITPIDYSSPSPMNNQDMTNVASSNDSSLLLLDWYTGGRKTQDNGYWQLDLFRSSTTISYITKTDEAMKEATTKSMPFCPSAFVFRDDNVLSGGPELQHHMRNYNVVCMVLLIGSRVQSQAKRILKAFSSRHSYHEVESKNEQNNDQATKSDRSNKNYNIGAGLNGEDGLLISCGTFPIPTQSKDDVGVVLRLASETIEQAAFFLSKQLGTLDGQLEDDPFLEILVSRQSTFNLNVTPKSNHKLKNNILSFGLVRNSFPKKRNTHGQKLNQPSNDINYAANTTPITVSLYQLIDSCTPTGGFAHSNTVEVAHQLHFINRLSMNNSFSPSSSPEYTLQLHVWEALLQSCTSLLPFLISSCKLFQISSSSFDCNLDLLIEEWLKLDSNLGANLTSHVSRRASIIQGSGMLRAYIQMFPHISTPLKKIKKRVMQLSTTCVNPSTFVSINSMSLFGVEGHAATCFGAVCGLLGINTKSCMSIFTYNSARDMINAAVRMNLVGPLEAGRIINEICSRLDIFLNQYLVSEQVDENIVLANRGIFDYRFSHQISPLVEIMANAHDRLYTRLFNS